MLARMRQTKLVCTLGPASIERVPELVTAGMDIARLNFSHGNVADHQRAAAAVREAASAAGRVVGILADLPGPKVRMGSFPGGKETLATGARFLLHPLDPATAPEGDATGVSTSHQGLPADLRAGDRVLLADGAVELRVLEPGSDTEPAVTEVVRGGVARSRTGVNVPSERLSLPAVSAADLAALDAALALGADFVAQSFVRRADDIRELRAAMADRAVPIVAKIETRAAIDAQDAILAESDAIMVARGDLGVEIDFEDVPLVQKELVRRARVAGVPVIVATQMLESMTAAPRPTRAEASDAANAVLDGADAIMLSAETAVGAFPIEAAQAAVRIVAVADERGARYSPPIDRSALHPKAGTWRPSAVPGGADVDAAWALAAAAADLADRDPKIVAIGCFTGTGRRAALLSSARPRELIVAFSPDLEVLRRLTIWHGVEPRPLDPPGDTDGLIATMADALQACGRASPGELVVLVASSPDGRGRTNLVKVHAIEPTP
ncbi:MAG: pyruvate kinase [Chloroflexi bacterium]|nr:pyruvate kinase [Chloroflexota bacterium]